MYCYADFLEEQKDEQEAARWCSEAADRGFADAQVRFGLMLELGKCGVAQSDTEAAKYYLMAAKQGHSEGMYNYAEMLENGKGVRKNVKEAKEMYQAAAKKGHMRARERLSALG
jgi:TPR repeat protein